MQIRSLGGEGSLEEEPGGLQSIGSQRVGHDSNDLACMHSNHLMRAALCLRWENWGWAVTASNSAGAPLGMSQRRATELLTWTKTQVILPHCAISLQDHQLPSPVNTRGDYRDGEGGAAPTSPPWTWRATFPCPSFPDLLQPYWTENSWTQPFPMSCLPRLSLLSLAWEQFP